MQKVNFMSGRRHQQRVRKSRNARSRLAAKSSQPPWLRGQLLFEQLESRVPPGSLLVSPLGDAALLSSSSTPIPQRPLDQSIGGSTVVQPSGSVQNGDTLLSQPSRPDSPTATRPVAGSTSTVNGAQSSLEAARPAPFASLEMGLNWQTIDERLALPNEHDDPDRIRLRVPPPSPSLADSSYGHNDPMRRITHGSSDGQAIQAQRNSEIGTRVPDSSSGSLPGSFDMPFEIS